MKSMKDFLLERRGMEKSLTTVEEAHRLLGETLTMKGDSNSIVEFWNGAISSLIKLRQDPPPSEDHVRVCASCLFANEVDTHYLITTRDGADPVNCYCHFCYHAAGKNCACAFCRCIREEWRRAGYPAEEEEALLMLVSPPKGSGTAFVDSFLRKYKTVTGVSYPTPMPQKSLEQQKTALEEMMAALHSLEGRNEESFAKAIEERLELLKGRISAKEETQLKKEQQKFVNLLSAASTVTPTSRFAPTSEGIQEMTNETSSIRKDERTKELTVVFKSEHTAAKLGVALDTTNMTYEEAASTLVKMATDRETFTEIDRFIEGDAVDCARAFFQAIKDKYGWAESQSIMGFFGPMGPSVINFPIAYGKTEEVPWGNIIIPGLEATIHTCAGHPTEDCQQQLTLHIKVRKKDVHYVDELVTATREILKRGSVYKGQAIELSFNPAEMISEGAPPLRTPKFLEPLNIDDRDIVFSKDVQTQIDVNLRTPIMATEELESDGIAIKRTILLGGEHGTGKTLELGSLQELCKTHGWTYISVTNANFIVEAIEWARRVEPAVIACEDIDPVVKGERDVEMNHLFETIDGIKSKKRRLVNVFTTNFPEEVQAGFVRTGRVDAYIHVTTPDAEAVARLIHNYGRGLIHKDEDLSEVGKELSGHKASTVSEVVKRSKLARRHRWIMNGRQGDPGNIKAQDLLDAITSMRPHFALMAKEHEKIEEYNLTDYLGELIRDEILDVFDQHSHKTGSNLISVKDKERDEKNPRRRILSAHPTGNGNGDSPAV